MAIEGKHFDKETGKYVDDDIFDPLIHIQTGIRYFKKQKLEQESTGGYKVKKMFGGYDKFNKSYKSFSKKSSSKTGAFQKNGYYYTNPNTKKNSQVVVRITGSNSSYEGLVNHIHYISRNGERPLISSEGERFDTYASLGDAYNSFGINSPIPTEAELKEQNKKPRKEVVHIIMSMKGKDPDLEKIRTAAEKTIKEIFPNQYFVSATHDDTDNNHVHICMRARDEIKDRAINIDKRKLDAMKIYFAQNLNALGIEATHNVKERISKKELDEDREAQTHFTVTSFGEAPFNFNPEKKPSYYVSYIDKKGQTITIWGEDLHRLIDEKNIHVNDRVRFEIVAMEAKAEKIRIRDKKKNVTYEKTLYKKVWDASIKGRDEKILKPMPKSEIATLLSNSNLKIVYDDATPYTKKYHNEQLKKQQEQSQPQIQTEEPTIQKTTIRKQIIRDEDNELVRKKE